MPRIDTWLECDLQHPVQVKVLNGYVFSQDNMANKIGVIVTDNGEPVELTGTVYGYIIRSDGHTIDVAGDIEDTNRAFFIMPQEGYLVGNVSIVIKVINASEITTLAACTSYVYESRTGQEYVPTGTPIPDLSTLEEAINNANTAASAANTAATNANAIAQTVVAPEFSSSNAYAVGQYVMKSGTLYRFTSAHTAGNAWSSSEVTAVKLANDTSDLKSALDALNDDTLRNTNKTISATNELIPLVYTKVENSGVSYSTGNQFSNSSYDATDFINVTEFDYIQYKKINATSSSTTAGLAFYDETKTRISGARCNISQSANGYASGLEYATIPANAVYVRLTMWHDTTTYGNFAVYGHSALVEKTEGNINSITEAENVLFERITSTSSLTWEVGTIDEYTGENKSSNKYVRYTGTLQVKAGSSINVQNGYLFIVCMMTIASTPAFIKCKYVNIKGRYVIPQDCNIRFAIKTEDNATQSTTGIESNFILNLYTPNTLLAEKATVEEHEKFSKLMLPIDILEGRRYVEWTSQTVHYEWNADRTKLSVSGTASPGQSFYNLYSSKLTPVTPGETIYLIVKTTDPNILIRVGKYNSSATSTGYLRLRGEPGVYPTKIPDDVYYISVRAQVEAGTSVNGIVEAYVTRVEPYSAPVSSVVDLSKALGLHVVADSIGMLNVIRRARQLTDVKWKAGVNIPRSFLPTADTYATSHGSTVFGIFAQGQVYKGVPYSLSNPVGTYHTIDALVTSSANPRSVMALESPGTQVDAACYYGSICTNLTSYAINLPTVQSKNYENIPGMTVVGNLSSLNLTYLKLADILKIDGHCAIISDIIYDNNDNVALIEIAESTRMGNIDPHHDSSGPYGGKGWRYTMTPEQFVTWFDGFKVLRYKYLDTIPYIPNPYSPMVDEYDPNIYIDMPVIPYYGNKYSISALVTGTVKLLINVEGYDHLVVTRNGTAWNQNGTTDPYDVTGLDEITITCNSGFAVYTAYLIKTSNGEITRQSISCSWVRRPSISPTISISDGVATFTYTTNQTMFTPWFIVYGDSVEDTRSNIYTGYVYKVFDNYTVTESSGTYTYTFTAPYPEDNPPYYRLGIQSDHYGAASTAYSVS